MMRLTGVRQRGLSVRTAGSCAGRSPRSAWGLLRGSGMCVNSIRYGGWRLKSRLTLQWSAHTGLASCADTVAGASRFIQQHALTALSAQADHCFVSRDFSRRALWPLLSVAIRPAVAARSHGDNMPALRAEALAKAHVVFTLLRGLLRRQTDMRAGVREGENQVLSRLVVYIDGRAVDRGGRQHADLARLRQQGDRLGIRQVRQPLQRRRRDRGRRIAELRLAGAIPGELKVAARPEHHGRAPLVHVRKPEEEAADNAAGPRREVGQRILDVDVLPEAERRIRLRPGRDDRGLEEPDALGPERALRSLLEERMLEDVEDFRVVVAAGQAGAGAALPGRHQPVEGFGRRRDLRSR